MKAHLGLEGSKEHLAALDYPKLQEHFRRNFDNYSLYLNLDEFQDANNQQQLEEILNELLSNYDFILNDSYQEEIKELKNIDDLIRYLEQLNLSSVGKDQLQKLRTIFMERKRLGKNTFEDVQMMISNIFEPVQINRDVAGRAVLRVQGGKHLALSALLQKIEKHLKKHPEYKRRDIYQALSKNDSEREDYRHYLLPENTLPGEKEKEKGIYLYRLGDDRIRARVIRDNEVVDELNLTDLAENEPEIESLLNALEWSSDKRELSLDSKLVNFIFDSCRGVRDIYIDVPGTLYLDCDLKFPGKNLVINANTACIKKNCTIDLSGRNGKPFAKERARSGEEIRESEGPTNAGCDGRPGEDGRSGAAGESSGNLVLNAKLTHDEGQQLKIIVKGGDGAKAQKGGHGGNGEDGKDGENGTVTDEKSFFHLRKRVYVNAATPPTKGGKGGDGGYGGLGGEGGFSGTVKFNGEYIFTGENECLQSIFENNLLLVMGGAGKDRSEKEAANGKGGTGGKGGYYARDFVCHHFSSFDNDDTGLYFHPDNTGVFEGGYKVIEKKVCGVAWEYIKKPKKEAYENALNNRKRIDSGEDGKKSQVLKSDKSKNKAERNEFTASNEMMQKCQGVVKNSKKSIEEEIQIQKSKTTEVFQSCNTPTLNISSHRYSQQEEIKKNPDLELFLVKNKIFNTHKKYLLGSNILIILEKLLVTLDYNEIDALLKSQYEIYIKNLLESDEKDDLEYQLKILSNNIAQEIILESSNNSDVSLEDLEQFYQDLIKAVGLKKEDLINQLDLLVKANVINVEDEEILQDSIYWFFNECRCQSESEHKALENMLTEILKKSSDEYKPLIKSIISSMDDMIIFQEAFSNLNNVFSSQNDRTQFVNILSLIERRYLFGSQQHKKVKLKSVSSLLEDIINSDLSASEVFTLLNESFSENWVPYLLHEQLYNQVLLFFKNANKDSVEDTVLSDDIVRALCFFIDSPRMMSMMLKKIRQENALVNDLSRISLADFKDIFQEKNHVLLFKQETINDLHELPIGEWSAYFAKMHWVEKLPDLDNSPVLKQEMFNLISDLYHRFDKNLIEQFIDKIPKEKPKYPEIIGVLHYLMRHESLFTKEILSNLSWDKVEGWMSILEEKKSCFRENKEELSRVEVIKELELDLNSDNCNAEKLLKYLDDIDEQYSSVPHALLSKPISEWSVNDIQTGWMDYIAEWKKQDKNWVQNHLTEVVAVMSRAVKLTCRFEPKSKPRDTQLLALLLYLDASNEGKGRLGEVATGEGKTVTTAMLAIVQALIGHPVNIITSSSVLAEENLNAMKPLYDCFRLAVSNNCDKEAQYNISVRKERYHSPIVYGDLGSFQRDFLLTDFLGKEILENRKNEMIIVDEVDNMLLDKGDNTLYLSHEIVDFRHLRNLYVEIWSAINNPDIKNHRNKVEFFRSVQEDIESKIKNKKISFPRYLDKFVEYRLSAWIEHAIYACQLRENDQFIDEEKDIVVMDNDTGVEQVSMHWSNGLHQFLQLLKTKKLTSESLKAVFQSNLDYFQSYKGRIYGISGTLGSESDKKLLTQMYQVDFFKMPRFMQHRFYEEEGIVVKSESEWLAEIEKDIKAKSNRPVLVICENIDSVKKIQEFLKNKVLPSKIHIYDKSSIKLKVGDKENPLQAGDIIIATNLAARGKDLAVSADLREAGGLHVSLTYMPPNIRVERQAFGRTSRQGERGTGKCIVFNPYVNDIYLLRRQRDWEAMQRSEQIRTSTGQYIHIEGVLFKEEFSKTYKDVKELLTRAGDDDFHKSYNEIQLKSLQDRWAFWLDEQNERIKDVTLLRKQFFIEAYKEFDKEVRKIAQKTERDDFYKFVESPHELIALGRCYLNNNKERALSCFEKVIEEYPFYAEVAHHWKARVLSGMDDTDKNRNAIKQTLKSECMLLEKRINDDLIPANRALLSAVVFNRNLGKGQSQNNFEKQIKNELELYQVHLSTIKNIIGRSFQEDMFNNVLTSDEQRKALYEKLVQQDDVVKEYRFNKKLEIKNEGDGKVLWISTSIGPKKLQLSSVLSNIQKNQIIDCIEKKIEAINEGGDHETKLRYLSGKEEFSDLVLSEESSFCASLTKQQVLDLLWKDLISQGVIKPRKFNVSSKDENSEKNKKIEKIKDCVKEEIFRLMGCEYILLLNSQPNSEDLAKVKLGKAVVFEKHGESCSIHFIDANKKYCHRPLDGRENTSDKLGFIDGVINDVSNAKYNVINQIFSSNAAVNNLNILKIRPRGEKRFLISGEFSRISMVNSKISRKIDIKPNSIALFKEDGNLIAYWINNGSIESKSIKISDDDEIQSLLSEFPDVYEDSQDKKLIDKVQSKFGCTCLDDMRNIAEVAKRNGYDISNIVEEQIKAVNKVIDQHIGQLKILPKFDVSAVNLRKFFGNRKCPAEIFEFSNMLFDEVLIFDKTISYWDWSAFAVAMLGVAQITMGIALTVFTTGFASLLGSVLIAEGISDIIFATQAGLLGQFSWESYGWHKALSLTMNALMISTMGVSAIVAAGEISGLVSGMSNVGKNTATQVIIYISKRLAFEVGKAVGGKIAVMTLTQLCNLLSHELTLALSDKLQAAIVESQTIKEKGKMLQKTMSKLFQIADAKWAQKIIEDTIAETLRDSQGNTLLDQIVQAACLLAEIPKSILTATTSLGAFAIDMLISSAVGSVVAAYKVSQLVTLMPSIYDALIQKLNAQIETINTVNQGDVSHSVTEENVQYIEKQLAETNQAISKIIINKATNEILKSGLVSMTQKAIRTFYAYCYNSFPMEQPEKIVNLEALKIDIDDRLDDEVRLDKAGHIKLGHDHNSVLSSARSHGSRDMKDLDRQQGHQHHRVYDRAHSHKGHNINDPYFQPNNHRAQSEVPVDENVSSKHSAGTSFPNELHHSDIDVSHSVDAEKIIVMSIDAALKVAVEGTKIYAAVEMLHGRHRIASIKLEMLREKLKVEKKIKEIEKEKNIGKEKFENNFENIDRSHLVEMINIEIFNLEEELEVVEKEIKLGFLSELSKFKNIDKNDDVSDQLIKILEAQTQAYNRIGFYNTVGTEQLKKILSEIIQEYRLSTYVDVKKLDTLENNMEDFLKKQTNHEQKIALLKSVQKKSSSEKPNDLRDFLEKWDFNQVYFKQPKKEIAMRNKKGAVVVGPGVIVVRKPEKTSPTQNSPTVEEPMGDKNHSTDLVPSNTNSNNELPMGIHNPEQAMIASISHDLANFAGTIAVAYTKIEVERQKLDQRKEKLKIIQAKGNNQTQEARDQLIQSQQDQDHLMEAKKKDQKHEKKMAKIENEQREADRQLKREEFNKTFAQKSNELKLSKIDIISNEIEKNLKQQDTCLEVLLGLENKGKSEGDRLYDLKYTAYLNLVKQHEKLSDQLIESIEKSRSQSVCKNRDNTSDDSTSDEDNEKRNVEKTKEKKSSVSSSGNNRSNVFNERSNSSNAPSYTNRDSTSTTTPISTVPRSKFG